MKKFILIVVLIIFGFAVSANAVLIDNGDGTITDTDTNLMWIQDASLGQARTWNDALNWADSLVFARYDDWRLPSALNMDGSGQCGPGYFCSDSEMGHLFYGELGGSVGGPPRYTDPFRNLRTDRFYWTGTQNENIPDLAWNFHFGYGLQDYSTKNNAFYVMAVRDINVVPEPISSVLFLTGGTFLAGRKYLSRKK